LGDTVAIVGAGTNGQVTLQAAKAAGASKLFVVEKAKARKEYAKNLGPTAVIDPTETDPVVQVLRLTDGLGVDVAFECVDGHQKTLR
jgi:(R,R)-butanediol dehydrogenase/meso-butanediol dehydrogenase/diacetyl reductase